MLLLFFACTDPEAAPERRQGPSEGQDPVDTGVEDSAEPLPDTEPCTAGAARALCALEDFAAGSAEGVEVTALGLQLADEGLQSGTDTTGAYNGGSYRYGVWTSAPLVPGLDFDGAIPSWNAQTPVGTWISVLMSARVGGEWTAWYRMGVWASTTSDLQRHSFEGEEDAFGEVWTDTLFLHQRADAVRLRVVLFTTGEGSPTVSRLSAAVARTGERHADAGGDAWGTALAVPERSQMVFDEGEAWCSPTSTSMILAFWAAQGEAEEVSVPEAASGTWDHTYQGNGNWPFNVAYAATLGLEGEVGWLGSMAEIEPWIARGAPVAISAAWEKGELDNAPISSTDGHLLVVTGFEADGDVIVNDPAASRDADVNRVYDRAQITEAWQGASDGVVYLLRPSSW